MKNTVYPHDSFIRCILSNKSIAIEYFKSYLPPFISSQLHFASLTQLPDTYLSEDLIKTMSDIVYSCQRKNGSPPVKISLLIEHKSYPDKHTSIQMGRYIFSALQKQVINKEPLSIVIPVLLYHGKGKWRYQTLTGLFEKVDADWLQYIPSFEYVYNNLGILDDEAVEHLNNKFLAASILALKHCSEKKWLSDHATKLLLWASTGSSDLQKGFIIYLYGRAALKEEKILNSLPDPIRKTIMNTLDIYIEKGRKEGIEKGKEQVINNLLATGKFSVAEIAAFAGVTEAFVKKQLQSSK
ncbi:Rpn family recombination-promoting nuclease/putative transposase [Niabella sp.]|uniref:Rpn family recombination-promoting nuclease/putative transposase n=1 Tax=Niabella sp. TaxID=1962976 RepID=UPI0026060B3A|nr:Rpn family recombination-promoting nuclease/putative transposase [Niabella sp.]